MCVIIDNDSFGLFLKQEKDLSPVESVRPLHKWLKNKNNKLAFSYHPRFKEYAHKYRETLLRYENAGQLKLIDEADVQQKLTEVKKQKPKSNDDHIIALSLAARVKVVFTGDHALHDDIKRIVKGSIYQNQNHAHLLTPDICP